MDTQQFWQLLGEHRVAVPAAIAILDLDEHPAAIDVADLDESNQPNSSRTMR